MRTQTGTIVRELYWDLAEPEPQQRRLRAAVLRGVYVECDPTGWDARQLEAEGLTFEQEETDEGQAQLHGAEQGRHVEPTPAQT